MSDGTTDEQVHAVEAIYEKVRPLFAGQAPMVVGAVLAELLATWLASHTCGEPGPNKKYRDELIRLHIAKVRQLIPIMEAEIGSARVH